MRFTSRVWVGVLSLAFGVVGFCVAWSAWHLVQDHTALHALVNMVVAQQQRAPAESGAKP